MKNRIQKTCTFILYLLRLAWSDNQSKTHFSHIYVGNDAKLSLDELGEVTHIWLKDRIDKRAKRVLGFKVLETVTS